MELKFLIGSVISVALFMLGHLLVAVWWASKMSANVDSMNEAIDRLASTINKHDDRFYEKEEAKSQIARRDNEIKDLWRAVNSLREELKECLIELGKVVKNGPK